MLMHQGSVYNQRSLKNVFLFFLKSVNFGYTSILGVFLGDGLPGDPPKPTAGSASDCCRTCLPHPDEK